MAWLPFMRPNFGSHFWKGSTFGSQKMPKIQNLLATRDSSTWANQDFEVPTVGYRPKKNGLEVWWPDWEIFQVGIGFLAKKERIIWTKQWFFRGKLFLTFRVIWSHFGVWQVLGTRTRFDCSTLGDSRNFLWKTRKRNHKNWNFPSFDALKNPISVDIRVNDRRIFVTNLLGGLRPNLDGLLEYIRADTQPFESSVFVGGILHSKPPELRQTCLRMHGWTDGRTDRPTDRRMDG